MTTTTSRVRFSVPKKEEVSAANQAIFDHMQSTFGKVPNIYATFAHSETALADYLALQNRKSTLSVKEREIINLVVSQVNSCKYCSAAHTAVGKMIGFTDEQILMIRRGSAAFDAKYDTLVKFVKDVAETKGHPSADTYDNFFAAGYTKANLVDAIIIIGDKIIANYLHNITDIPVDWPEIPQV